jgi:hypothetical protein
MKLKIAQKDKRETCETNKWRIDNVGSADENKKLPL